MKTKKYFSAVKMRWLIIFILLSACVDRIYFNVPPPQFQTVVEGMISDNPGPYAVKVSKGLSLDSDTSYHSPVRQAKIRLFDDEGNSEDLTEIRPGEYLTGGAIRGKVGHAYHIRLETSDGNIFESEPDTIHPVGEVDQIRFEFEARTIKKDFGDLKADVFNIYLDAHAAPNENYVRWRYNGTYKAVTHPEEHSTFLQVSSYRTPLPCSGYIITEALGGGKLLKVDECTCCTCWVNQFEELPLLSDRQFISDNQFKNLKIAEVPINNVTFFDKFMVEVEQMSLSEQTFNFFRLVRAQKEGASNIFQPPSGEISGNVIPVNSNAAVIGIFWAASVRTKTLFIPRSEVPYPLTDIDFVADACNQYYHNSSTAKPKLWE
jgi:hypothetical protein